MSIKTLQHQQTTIWLTGAAQALGIEAKHFEPEYLLSQKLVSATAMGRGTVYFFQLEDANALQHTLVLRHYCRGGLITKLSKDRFWFTGLVNTRCAKELLILQTLQNHKVNVPTPIAARITKHALTYQADIITAAVPRSTELHEHLLNTEVPNTIWQKIGQEIRKMHHAQVCHYDINVKNILLSKDELSSNNDIENSAVFLLDFDKCEVKPGNNWKQANIERFRRSIDKQIKKHKPYHFSEANWQAFLSEYSLSE